MSGISGDATLPEHEPWHLTWTPTFVVFLAYMFIIVTYKFGIGTIVMAVALVTLLLQRGGLRVPTFLWWFAAWIAWAAIGYALTPYPDQVGPSLIEHVKLLLVALVAVNALRTPTQVRYFILCVLASYLLFPVRATLVNYLTGYTRLGRAVGPFIYENSNDLAAITILMLAPALALWAGEARRPRLRWIGLAAAVPLIVTILLTQSRGAFIALAVIGLPSGIALARRRPRLAPALVLLVALALYLAPAGLWERLAGLGKATSFETIAEMDPEGSAQQRFAVLQTAARMVGDRPLLGVGLGAYAHANLDYSPALGMLDTHNTYMNIAAETGLPGLALFVALLTSVLLAARDARRGTDRGSPSASEMLRWLQVGLVAFLAAGVFGSFSKLAFAYVYLALLWSASQMVPAVHPPVQQATTAV